MYPAMTRLAKLFKALHMEFTCEHDPDDDMTDDSLNLKQATPDGREISVQCATPYSPREQQDYIISLFDETSGVFTHIPESKSRDLDTTVSTVRELISGKYTVA